MPCFRLSEKHRNLAKEFDDQLEVQQNGLNDLTVDEYLKGRKAFTDGDVVRDPKVARDARNEFRQKLKQDFIDELRSKNISASEAESQAELLAAQKMSTLAALHNPDLFAGGKDIIGGFGDKRINSSIGPQWSNRIGGLDSAANDIPESIRDSTKINAKLERCDKKGVKNG